MALMTSENGVEVRFTKPFRRRLKSLLKRYRRVKQDIQSVLEELLVGNFVGDQVSGIGETVFKARIANTDIPAGKRGGYRLIYQIVSPALILLLFIYSKSDLADISGDEIREAISEAMAED
jgi:mRNA-degrading endonuclease RelE of RelBE toxin-antitoxin system